MTLSEKTNEQIISVFEHMVAEANARLAGDAATELVEGQKALLEVTEMLDFSSPMDMLEDSEAMLAVGILLPVAEHIAKQRAEDS